MARPGRAPMRAFARAPSQRAVAALLQRRAIPRAPARGHSAEREVGGDRAVTHGGRIRARRPGRRYRGPQRRLKLPGPFSIRSRRAVTARDHRPWQTPRTNPSRQIHDICGADGFRPVAPFLMVHVPYVGCFTSLPSISPLPPSQDACPMTSALFSPIRLADLELTNRIVVSPMCQYSADDGVASDWHLNHLGMLANSGAALVVRRQRCPGLFWSVAALPRRGATVKTRVAPRAGCRARCFD